MSDNCGINLSPFPLTFAHPMVTYGVVRYLYYISPFRQYTSRLQGLFDLKKSNFITVFYGFSCLTFKFVLNRLEF